MSADSPPSQPEPLAKTPITEGSSSEPTHPAIVTESCEKPPSEISAPAASSPKPDPPKPPEGGGEGGGGEEEGTKPASTSVPSLSKPFRHTPPSKPPPSRPDLPRTRSASAIPTAAPAEVRTVPKLQLPPPPPLPPPAEEESPKSAAEATTPGGSVPVSPAAPSSSSGTPRKLTASQRRRGNSLETTEAMLPAARRFKPPESVEIVETETVTVDKSPITVYHIEVRVPGQEPYRVNRRYNQFLFLHKKLKAEGFDSERPALPPKRLFFNLSADFVSQRKEQLQKYLTAVIKTEVLSRSDGLADFLDPSMPASEMVTDPEKEGFVHVFKKSHKAAAVEKMKAGEKPVIGSAWKSGWLVMKNNYLYLFRKPPPQFKQPLAAWTPRSSHTDSARKISLVRKIVGLEFCTVEVIEPEKHVFEIKSAVQDIKGQMILRTETAKELEDWLFSIRMCRLSKTEMAEQEEPAASFRKTAVRIRKGGLGFMRGAQAAANVPGGAIVRSRSNAATAVLSPEKTPSNKSLVTYMEGGTVAAAPAADLVDTASPASSSARAIKFDPDSDENILWNPRKPGYIKAATVDKLFHKLIDANWLLGYEYTDYVTSFLLTYRTFSTPHELLETLMKEFADSPGRPRHLSTPVQSSASSAAPPDVPKPSTSAPVEAPGRPSSDKLAPLAVADSGSPGTVQAILPSASDSAPAIPLPASDSPGTVQAIPPSSSGSPGSAPAIPPSTPDRPGSDKSTPLSASGGSGQTAATEPPTSPRTATEQGTPAGPIVQSVSQMRVCNIIAKWLDVHFYDFVEDEELARKLLTFIDKALPASGLEAAAAKLKINIWKHLSPPSGPSEDFLSEAPEPIVSIHNAETGAWAEVCFQLIDVSPIEAARQLSIIDWELFKKIKPKECLKQSWTKPGKETRAPNILEFINRFNTLSRWASSVIARTEQARARVAMLSLLIEIAFQCFLLNNYNSALAIASGLQGAAIYRLKKTWDGLAQQAISRYEQLVALMSRDGNFHNFREQTRAIRPPFVPYLGVFLTDLVMIDEGNPDVLPNGMINFDKSYMISKIIHDIQIFQQVPYRLRPVPELREYFQHLPVLTEEELYALSIKWEPRTPSSSGTSATPLP